MAALTDPTVEFMSQFGDESKWLVKTRVPLFKPHERIKTDAKGVKKVAYVVTADDMAEIAANMRINQAKGVPARMTIGHVNPDHNTPETDQPQVVGYWLNAEPGTFGPDNEPCVYVDAYAKRECAADVKGRPYRSAEYYPATKDIRGAALLTRDPQLDLGTVEIYARRKGAYLYSAPGEFYMADEAAEVEKLDDVGPELMSADGEPEGHKEWSANMEHYSKRNEWIGYAMHCYQQNQASAPSATNDQIPGDAKPAGETKEPEMERLKRDDAAVNYARITGEVNELKRARDSDRATIAQLTAERDLAVCERMVKQLQAEGYQLQAADEVPALLKKSPEGREEYVALIKKHATPVLTGMVFEPYSGNAEGPLPAKQTKLTAEQAAKAARFAQQDPNNSSKRWKQATSCLLAGEPLPD